MVKKTKKTVPLKDIQDEITQANTTLKNIYQIIDAKKSEFNALIQSITDREDIVGKREKQVEELEKEVVNKHNAIKAFASSL